MFRKEALDRFSTAEELEELMQVTTPRSWLILLALGSLIVAALIWGYFTTIATTVTGRGALSLSPHEAKLRATVYVTLADAPLVEPGMPVKITIAGVQKLQPGLLLGSVTVVDEFPAPQAAMLHILGSDTMVQSLASAGLLIPVQVELQPDASTPSGYAWSSARGPDGELRRGMLLDAKITIHEQRAIAFVFQ
jgi:HlyD family secretion protein